MWTPKLTTYLLSQKYLTSERLWVKNSEAKFLKFEGDFLRLKQNVWEERLPEGSSNLLTVQRGTPGAGTGQECVQQVMWQANGGKASSFLVESASLWPYPL